MKKFSIILASLFFCLNGLAEKKLYTKRVKMQDICSLTTKVVVGGRTPLDLAFMEEIKSRWKISPYEFCTPEEYGILKESCNYYFLRLLKEDGIIYLALTKGGMENEKNNLKKPFEVVKFPLCQGDDNNLEEISLTGPFLDAMQRYLEDALTSDAVAYAGLGWYNLGRLKGIDIITDPDDALDALDESRPGAFAGIIVKSRYYGPHSLCYYIVISCDTHELKYFKKQKYSSESDVDYGKFPR